MEGETSSTLNPMQVKQLKQTLESNGIIWAVDYMPNSNLLMASSGDNIIKWDVTARQLKQVFKGHERVAYTLIHNFDGNILATGSGDKTIKLWDPKTGKLKKTLRGHREKWGLVTTLIFSPDGNTLASGSTSDAKSFRGSINIWDTRTGKLKQTIKNIKEGVGAISYSPNSNTLAFSSDSGNINLWDLKTGQSKQISKGHKKAVTALSYSPDGNTLASGSFDETIKLWDITTGKIKQSINGHKAWINDLRYNPSGTILASSSKDNTIKLWNAITGKLEHTLRGHEASVESLSYNSNGSVLASGSVDGTIKIWSKYALMTQDLFYKYDPNQVSSALQFLWKMGLDEETLTFVRKVRTPALYPNKWGYYYSSDMDKFMPLLEMPKQGEVKADQLIQWLKDQCAYKDPALKTQCQNGEAIL